MTNLIVDIYTLYSVKYPMIDAAVFPNTPDEAFAITFGDWWNNPNRDMRYMRIQDYINLIESDENHDL